jgi:hypothetical protein
VCAAFSKSVGLKTKALNGKKAMPDGIKYKTTGKKVGSTDSKARKNVGRFRLRRFWT